MNRKEISTIKIMADYQCFPLWLLKDGIIENVNPEHLLISFELKELLHDWQKKYDATLNTEYPPNSGFKTKMEENDFESQGRKIWNEMLNELSKFYRVIYFSDATQLTHDCP